MITVAVIVCAVSAYLLPSLIASNRRAHAATSVFALNLLLGWTVIGWCAAFLWACCGARRDEIDCQRLMLAALRERRR